MPPDLTKPSSHTFDSLIGHDLARRYLASAAEGGILPHATLFHGPRGVGKTSMAYALAKLVNTPEGSSRDWAADVDRKITEGVFPDLLLVEPRGAAGQITLSGWKPGKDDPDGLQYYRFIDSRPMEGVRKVLIIRQAERMNVALANYLLKLIEEPPSYLLIILLTHRRSEVLTTIRSRCAPVKLSPLTMEEMERFAARALSPPPTGADLQMLLRLSEGRPGLMLELAGSAGAKRRAETARLMRLFQQYGFVGLFRVASELQRAGAEGSGRGGAAAQENFEAALSALQGWLRDAEILKSVSSPEKAERFLVNADLRQELEAYASQATLEGLAAAADRVREAYQYVPRQTDKSFVLEMLLLQIGRAMRPL